jgi:glutamate--cysteine ligase
MLKFTCCHTVQEFLKPEQARLLRGIRRGFEREALRVDAQGYLAQTPHPTGLGAKLTHPFITTDYAEALLEFITPPLDEPAQPLAFLSHVHRFAARQLGDELLWAGSMPCRIGDDDAIAIADYGPSNAGRFKMVYRHGLGLRYGRAMQTIAGAHYNWSLPNVFWQALQASCGVAGPLQSFVDDRLFGLIRNFLRFGWLIPYLFGASPALCKTFLQGHPSELVELAPGTLHGPYATSLRMSDLGYQNHAQDKLGIGFNSLADYCSALESAIRTPDPYYTELGVRSGDTWHQLSDSILQIEAEFYAPMRPKRVSDMRPAKALRLLGVEYLEMRLFDINPFIDIGIAPEQPLFADVLLLMCLLRDSPPISAREQGENDENKHRVVTRGRQPQLQLLVHNHEQPLRDLAHTLFDDMTPYAEMLDAAYDHRQHSAALAALRQRVAHPDLTPSAQVLEAVAQHGGYFNFAHAMSQRHTEHLRSAPLAPETLQQMQRATQESRGLENEISKKTEGSFADFVAGYFA